MRFVAFATLCFCFVVVQSSAAAVVGFNFSGSVSNVFQDPFAAGLTGTMPVSGRVLYDNESSASDPLAGCDTCMGYRQHIAGGLSATFGEGANAVLVRADDYVVQIKNDRPQPGNVILDTLSVVISPGFDPPLASPLWVKKMSAPNPSFVAYPSAWFQVNLDGASSTFADASLPQSLDMVSFNSIYNFLDEVRSTGVNMVDVLFTNNAFSSLALSPGDYDGNGSVDGNDYSQWRSTFGQTSPLNADGNSNHIVDAADYVTWRKHLTPSSLGAATVPESSAISLLTFSLLALASGRFDTRSRG